MVSDWWIAEWYGKLVLDKTYPPVHHCLFCYRAGCLSGNMSASNESLPAYCYLTHGQRIGVSGGLVGVVVALSFVRVVLAYMVMVNASRLLHNLTFASILRVPVRFFDTNPIG